MASLDDEIWQPLVRAYENKAMVLALGAGVSVGCGLPGWQELLARIAEAPDPQHGRSLVSRLRAGGHSLGMIAAVLEARIGGELFAEALRDALYRDFEFYRARLDDTAKGRLTTLVQSSNPTLAAVAAFCACPAGPGFVPNRRVQAVVNMNFDAILTRYATARYGKSLLRTIERPSAARSSRRIPVYHPHGFLDFDRKAIGNPEAEAPDIRVLTEQEFFDFFNAPNAIFSYTFLYLLREFRVLFIGLSLNDDNLRRLLHYSAREIYGSTRRERRSKEEAHAKMLRHVALQLRADEGVDRAVEESLERLGIRVVWYDHHREIPEILGALYESTAARWSEVYP